MRGNIIIRIVSALVLLAVIAGLGYFAYNAGLASGLAQTAAGDAARNVPVVPFGFYGHPWFGPFFGFGFLGCLIPLFLIWIAFAALRHLIWGGWGWRRHGHWGMHHMHPGEWQEGVPPMFSEWHRRAHGEPPSEPADKPKE